MQQVNAPGVRWEWISEAWNLFTRQWSVWVKMSLMILAVIIGAYLPMVSLSFLIPTDPDSAMVAIFPILSLLFTLLFMAVLVGAIPWMFAGLYSAAFKQVRGEEISVRDLFSGGKYFLRVILAGILIGIGANIGAFLCVVPGLVFVGVTFLTYPMIVEGGKGAIDAIKASIEVTKKDWLMFTLFAIALGFIAQAGFLACGIGLIATLPLLPLGQALAYRDLVGIPGAQSQGGQLTPPSDYRSYTPSQAPSASSSPDYKPYTPSPAPPAPPQPPSWAAETTVSPVVSEPSTKTCPHCGATLARVVNFCNQCGRPLRSS